MTHFPRLRFGLRAEGRSSCKGMFMRWLTVLCTLSWLIPGPVYGQVAVGTRRGEVWLIDNAYDTDPSRARFSRFAHGLHEVLGLAYRDGWLYVVQRPDVTRIKDTNGDGKADVFEVVSEGW